MKFRLTLLIMMLITIPLSAQDFTGELNVGIGASQIDGDTWFGYDKFNGLAGFMVSINAEKKSFFCIGVQLCNRGSKKDQSTNDITYSKIGLRYVELPIYLKIRTKKKFVFLGGLVPSYMIGNVKSFENGDPIPDDGYYKKYDLGLALGVEYQLVNRLWLQYRFMYSTLPIHTNPNQWNNSMNLSISYKMK